MLVFYSAGEVNLNYHLRELLDKNGLDIIGIESCFYVETSEPLDDGEIDVLTWIFSHPLKKGIVSKTSTFNREISNTIIEIGPRLSFSTPFCTNAVAICQHAGLKAVTKIEKSVRYMLRMPSSDATIPNEVMREIFDPMTQMVYPKPLVSFESPKSDVAWTVIDVIEGGEQALKMANDKLGLALDEQDIQYYTDLFRNKLVKNPTSVECFDLAQSNSEHSRHWFFNGIMTIDGHKMAQTMFQMVKNTQHHSNANNIIAFRDNSSAIRGYEIESLVPLDVGKPSIMSESKSVRHITLTAETHNFPTGVAPFPGATTGTGGRQRDQHAAGQGSHITAGTAGYCIGNLNLDHHVLLWEDGGRWDAPDNLASAVKIAIEASDGASDYGNKFGEPVVTGFFRSFGVKLPNGDRREWLKPIMFSGGVGAVDDKHTNKIDLTKVDNFSSIKVGKIGGPAYRIGVGGGSASSLIQGQNTSERDFDAVQRGDAQMQQKLNRVIRACIEMTENPILSIHDQGAGGNGNVLKEIAEPAGAVIHADKFTLGDTSLTIQELWVAEYQESDAILLQKDDVKTVESICKRERVKLDVVGELTGNGRVALVEGSLENGHVPPKKPRIGSGDVAINHPVDLDLKHVLGRMKPKEYTLTTQKSVLKPLELPDIPIKDMILRVLKLPSVGSKRFLTNKVDRSVGGLIAQQQCVGPLHTPLADVAVTALSHFTTKGAATAIGEQPIKLLVDPCIGARLSVAEALTNLVFAKVSDLRDVKCSANWMWPAKLPGEGAAIYAACSAMCEFTKQLGIAVDGGKDSLSMAARVNEETVKCPGSLVISAYAPCPDIRVKATPDLKCPGGEGHLLYIPMSTGKSHLGGTALAQCFSQIGDKITDVDVDLFVRAWKATQLAIQEGLVLSGHDVSDGGLVTCLLEMAFAGNVGLSVDIATDETELDVLFSEKPGIVLEVQKTHLESVVKMFEENGCQVYNIGKSMKERKISVYVNGIGVLENESTNVLRDVWESTSFALERLQCDNDCVTQERDWLLNCDNDPPYLVTFNDDIPRAVQRSDVKVGVIREEGSNGDREMCAAFLYAGFEVWDVTMQDLLTGGITLDRFRGVVFVGGFSYADVFGSAKGWAACTIFNPVLRKEFDNFRKRPDTFSLGVCNGCQLMALLGWIGPTDCSETRDRSSDDVVIPAPTVYLTHNKSGRFESRFVTVKIADTPSIMLKGMSGSQLGVWVAHGEGQFKHKDAFVLESLKQNNLIPLQYIDHSGAATVRYPLNPNGSPEGVAGVCSPDGRHLAMMPHPERAVEMWQLPWSPSRWREKKVSPWRKMFANAMDWCLEKGGGTK